MHFRALFLFAFIFFVSCVSLKPVYFDVLKPADFFVDKRVANVVLLNLSKPQRDVSHFVVVKDRDPVQIDSLWNDDFNNIILETFHSDLSAKQFFDSVCFDSTAYFHSSFLLASRDLKSVLDSVAMTRNVQGVYFLSQSHYQTNYHLEPVSLNYYWGYLEGISTLKIGFYNALSQEFEDYYSLKDTLFLDGQTGTLTELGLSLTPTETFVGQMATHIGGLLNERYVPYWENVQRAIFVGGSYYFNEGGRFAALQKWPDAIKFWRFAFDKGTLLEKTRACWNLAVMAEMNGDIPSAKSWLEQSRQLFKAKEAKFHADLDNVNTYLKILNLREKELVLLGSQVGDEQ